LAHVEYYLSLNSPWAYLGAARFSEIVRARRATVTVKLARFADIFAQTGGLHLAQLARVPRHSPGADPEACAG
jgi:2-hydroxychromene-2-carboxylate isomerase